MTDEYIYMIAYLTHKGWRYDSDSNRWSNKNFTGTHDMYNAYSLQMQRENSNKLSTIGDTAIDEMKAALNKANSEISVQDGHDTDPAPPKCDMLDAGDPCPECDCWHEPGSNCPFIERYLTPSIDPTLKQLLTELCNWHNDCWQLFTQGEIPDNIICKIADHINYVYDDRPNLDEDEDEFYEY